MRIPKSITDGSARLLPTTFRTIIAHSVAGGGWLLSRGALPPVWIQPASTTDLPDSELQLLARLGRTLLLSGSERRASLAPSHVRWLLENWLRVACLIDFLAVGEDPARLRGAPLHLTFAPTGVVSWSFDGVVEPEPVITTVSVAVTERRSFARPRPPLGVATVPAQVELHAS